MRFVGLAMIAVFAGAGATVAGAEEKPVALKPGPGLDRV